VIKGIYTVKKNIKGKELRAIIKLSLLAEYLKETSEIIITKNIVINKANLK